VSFTSAETQKLAGTLMDIRLCLNPDIAWFGAGLSFLPVFYGA